ncbi:MAG: hypothetical protein Q8L45_15985 [Xanthomonadaceae bacterium]|nr:hypothetical protein [Xanthomonadaceae bacterium]MDP2185883.1 hypothetical protein [Xanthomonadales bacterium]
MIARGMLLALHAWLNTPRPRHLHAPAPVRRNDVTTQKTPWKQKAGKKLDCLAAPHGDAQVVGWVERSETHQASLQWLG